MLRGILAWCMCTIGIIGSAAVGPASSQTATLPPHDRIAVVLDASGSMRQNKLSDGVIYWDAAKRTVDMLLNGLPKRAGKGFSFVQFGANHAREERPLGTCKTVLEEPLQPVLSRGIDGAITKLNGLVADGNTSLGQGLQEAWQHLDHKGGLIVIVTDLDDRNQCDDPCATYKQLSASRSASAPKIEVGYIISVGDRGFRYVQDLANCVGGAPKKVVERKDVPPIVEEILDRLGEPKDAQVVFEAKLTDPAGLGLRLPRLSAVVREPSKPQQGLVIGVPQTVGSSPFSISVKAVQATTLEANGLAAQPGVTSKVQVFYTPPRVTLKLERAMTLPDTKWKLSNQSTGQEFFLQGPIVDQYLSPGDYDVQVWSGEAYLKDTVMGLGLSRHRLDLLSG